MVEWWYGIVPFKEILPRSLGVWYLSLVKGMEEILSLMFCYWSHSGMEDSLACASEEPKHDEFREFLLGRLESSNKQTVVLNFCSFRTHSAVTQQTRPRLNRYI